MKARFTVISKILGVCAIIFSLIGFYVLIKYSENISLALWNTVYMVFIPMGGIFNILDSGRSSYSKAACLSYALAIILRTFFDITIAKKIHWDFLLMLAVALSISALRYFSVRKVEQNRKDTASSDSANNNHTDSVAPNHLQVGGNGWLASIIGIILLLIGLSILGVKLKFFVFFIPIK